MPPQLTSLLPPLFGIGIALLAVAGLLLWWTSSRDRQATARTSPPPEQHENMSIATSSDAPAQTAQVVASHPVEPGMVEVMRVLRDLADGSLIIELDGQRYRTLREITDPQVGRRFLGNAQAVAQFAHLGEVKVPLEPVPPAPAPPPAAPPTQPEPLFEQTSAPAPSKPKPAASAPPQKRGGLFGGKQAAASEEEEQGYVEPPSIAEQIEEMLQERLTSHPEFKGRNIHIFPTLDGGLRIYVDAESFDSVSDVSDTAVRELLQSIIRDWEAAQ